MQHINVTLTSRRRKFYCATDANSDAESSIHEKRYQQCSLFILSSMLRIFSPPPAVAPEYVRSLKGEAASMFFLIHVLYLQRYTHVSTPTHIFDFRMLSVCIRIRIRTTVPFSAPYSPERISRVYHWSASESDRYKREKEGRRQSEEIEKERKSEGENK